MKTETAYSKLMIEISEFVNTYKRNRGKPPAQLTLTSEQAELIRRYASLSGTAPRMVYETTELVVRNP